MEKAQVRFDRFIKRSAMDKAGVEGFRTIRMRGSVFVVIGKSGDVVQA